VAVTRRGQTVSFYINGRPAGTTTVTGNLADNPLPVLIGTDDPDGTTRFKGLIDEVRIYNQALSAAEIQKLSLPRLGIALASTDVILSWPATGLGFMVEMSEDLNSGLWSPVTQVPRIENSQTKLTVEAAPQRRFYRLKRN
jgi:hypothetical protein